MTPFSALAELCYDQRLEDLTDAEDGLLNRLWRWCGLRSTEVIPEKTIRRLTSGNSARSRTLKALVSKGLLSALPDGSYSPAYVPDCMRRKAPVSSREPSVTPSVVEVVVRPLSSTGPDNTQVFEESGLHVIGTVSALKREEREEKREELRGECAAVASPRPKRVREAKPKVPKAESPRSLAHRVFAEVAKELGMEPKSAYLGYGSQQAVERAELIAEGGDLAAAMRLVAKGSIAWWRAGRSNSLRYAVQDWDGEAEVTPRATVTQLHGRQPRQAPCAPASAFKDQDPIEQILEYERRCAEHDEKLARTGTPFNPLVNYV